MDKDEPILVRVHSSYYWRYFSSAHDYGPQRECNQMVENEKENCLYESRRRGIGL